MVNPQVLPQRKDLFFIPTLAIGIGGTGQRIIRRLKHRTYATFGDFPLIRFLVFDTDTTDNPTDEPPLDRRELTLLAGYNPRDLLRDLGLPDKAPMKNRLPREILAPQAVQRLSSFIHMGTQQNRIVSLIGLFMRFGTVKQALQAAILDILSFARSNQLADITFDGFRARSTPPTDGGFPFRVVIVCSLGGGTGSGLFMDIAYLCRSFLHGQIPQIHGVFVLPPVLDLAVQHISTVQRERIRANTYAALKELDALSERSRWNFTYPENVIVDETAPPFDFCYLLDRANEHGQGFTQAESVWENISQSLFDFISPTIFGYLGTFYGNTEILSRYFPGYGDAQNRDSRDRRQGYSSFIAGSLSIPLQRLEDYCGARLAQDVLSQSGETAATEPESLIERNAAFINRVLSPQSTLQRLTAGLLVPRWPGVQADDLRLAVSQAAQQENLDREWVQAAEKTIHERQQDILREMTTEIRGYANNLLKEVGAAGALAGLDVLTGAQPISRPVPAECRCSLAQLSDAVGKLAGLEQARAAYSVQRKILNELVTDGIRAGLRRRMAREAHRRVLIESLIAARDRRLASEVEGAARAALAGILLQVAEDARSLRATLAVTAVGLGQCQSCLTDDRRMLELGESIPGSPMLEPAYEMGLSVVEVRDMERLYHGLTSEADRAQAGNALRSLISTRNLDDFERLARNESAARALATNLRLQCSKLYRERLHRLDVLDFLIRAQPDRPPQEVIREEIVDILQRAVPLWRYDKNRLYGDLEHLAILAVADADDTRIPDSLRDPAEHFQIRSSSIRWRIDLLHIRHGVPAGLLYEAAEWRQAYDRNVKSPIPLHIMPEPDFPDLIPPDVAPRVSGGERGFALGLALGFIANTGNNSYYFDPRKEYTTKKLVPLGERFLARGRVQAMDAFSRIPAWVTEMNHLADRSMLTEGRLAVVEKVQEAIGGLEAELRRVSPNGDLAVQYHKERELLAQFITELD